MAKTSVHVTREGGWTPLLEGNSPRGWWLGRVRTRWHDNENTPPGYNVVNDPNVLQGPFRCVHPWWNLLLYWLEDVVRGCAHILDASPSSCHMQTRTRVFTPVSCGLGTLWTPQLSVSLMNPPTTWEVSRQPNWQVCWCCSAWRIYVTLLVMKGGSTKYC